MRAKKHNPLSRRRSRRPDGSAYRDMRRGGMRGRRGRPIRLLVIVLLIAVIFYAFWRWW